MSVEAAAALLRLMLTDDNTALRVSDPPADTVAGSVDVFAVNVYVPATGLVATATVNVMAVAAAMPAVPAVTVSISVDESYAGETTVDKLLETEDTTDGADTTPVPKPTKWKVIVPEVAVTNVVGVTVRVRTELVAPGLALLIVGVENEEISPIPNDAVHTDVGAKVVCTQYW